MSDAQNVGVVPYEIYRAQRANEARLEAATLQMDVAPAGGVYREGDRWVDANGNAVAAPKPAEASPQKVQDPPIDEGPYAGKKYTELKEIAESRGLEPGASRESVLTALLAADAQA